MGEGAKASDAGKTDRGTEDIWACASKLVITPFFGRPTHPATFASSVFFYDGSCKSTHV